MGYGDSNRVTVDHGLKPKKDPKQQRLLDQYYPAPKQATSAPTKKRLNKPKAAPIVYIAGPRTPRRRSGSTLSAEQLAQTRSPGSTLRNILNANGPGMATITEGSTRSPKKLFQPGSGFFRKAVKCTVTSHDSPDPLNLSILTLDQQTDFSLLPPEHKISSNEYSYLMGKNRITLASVHTIEETLSADVIKATKGKKRQTKQDNVMKHTAISHMLYRGLFNYDLSTGKKLKIRPEWGHCIGFGLTGEDPAKKDNLMVVTPSANQLLNQIEKALADAILEHAAGGGVGNWHIKVESTRMCVTDDWGRAAYHTHIATKQVYFFTFEDNPPFILTVNPLDPNPISYQGTKQFFKNIFSKIMRGESLFFDNQGVLPMDAREEEEEEEEKEEENRPPAPRRLF